MKAPRYSSVDRLGRSWYCLSWVDPSGVRWFFVPGVLEGPHFSKDFRDAAVSTDKGDFENYMNRWPAFRRPEFKITLIRFRTA